ncbi:peptide chain release factor N(5)-glutamine methyltransferase [Jeotgalibaca ciconiae]|uniref:Release factor glutamine methyltransferase n=1 Tax=Jeotgalibaca ciconiae TaxID=2496265 RepID=A0A3Q9BIP4_9LACT|nr:peptide chain release factor N(5)-glutamine methyltransferase [Jeotgalibaca ciconiae]AZP03261.1 peptide chain release factor N(5)-glutamine methyltransferase [Jeotgalibaca ciconiae]
MVSISTRTYQQVVQNAVKYLEKFNKNTYVAERLLIDRLDWTKTDFIRHLKDEMTDSIYLQYLDDLNQFIEGKPLQYIVGKEWFYGIPLKVTKDTLIPRPETEELVHAALKHLNQTVGEKPLRVLDIGTGSGAIAITMKSERPQDIVTATDISGAALDVAKKNTESLDLAIRFLQGDLLEPVSLETFDCIISNPPYIGFDEKELMDVSVLQHEPHSALFADNGGFSVYERLAYELPFYLKTDGCLFMEIGFQQGEKLQQLYQQAFPDKEVSIQKDINGLDRMLIVK